MSERSSIRFPHLAALAACALAGACAHAPGGGSAQMSAVDMPELGESAPVVATVAPTRPVRGSSERLVTARLDLNTPVARLCADPRAKAVLDTDLPGLTTRPEFPFFKNMSLRTLQRMSRGQMSHADLAKIQAELAQLPPDPAFESDR